MLAPSILLEQAAFDAPCSHGPADCEAWSNHPSWQHTHSNGFRSVLAIHHPLLGEPAWQVLLSIDVQVVHAGQVDTTLLGSEAEAAAARIAARRRIAPSTDEPRALRRSAGRARPQAGDTKDEEGGGNQ
jgi:hypothetical protein